MQFLEKGFPKDSMGFLAVLLIPFGVIAPLLVSKATSGQHAQQVRVDFSSISRQFLRIRRRVRSFHVVIRLLHPGPRPLDVFLAGYFPRLLIGTSQLHPLLIASVFLLQVWFTRCWSTSLRRWSMEGQLIHSLTLCFGRSHLTFGSLLETYSLHVLVAQISQNTSRSALLDTY